jgi:hypothetical protein
MEKSNVSSSFFFFPFWHSFFVYDRRVPLVFLAKEIMNAVWGGGEASCPSLATLSVSAVFVVCVYVRVQLRMAIVLPFYALARLRGENLWKE